MKQSALLKGRDLFLVGRADWLEGELGSRFALCTFAYNFYVFPYTYHVRIREFCFVTLPSWHACLQSSRLTHLVLLLHLCMDRSILSVVPLSQTLLV